MPKMSKAKPSAPTADEIAEMATRGEDISAYFTNKFTVVGPVRRVNIDPTPGVLRERRALNQERAMKAKSRKNS